MALEPSQLLCGVAGIRPFPIHPMWSQSVAGLRAVAIRWASMGDKVTLTVVAQEWRKEEKPEADEGCS